MKLAINAKQALKCLRLIKGCNIKESPVVLEVKEGWFSMSMHDAYGERTAKIGELYISKDVVGEPFMASYKALEEEFEHCSRVSKSAVVDFEEHTVDNSDCAKQFRNLPYKGLAQRNWKAEVPQATIIFDKEDLQTLVGVAQHSSRDEARFAIEGMYVSSSPLKNNRLSFVATNGATLAVFTPENTVIQLNPLKGRMLDLRLFDNIPSHSEGILSLYSTYTRLVYNVGNSSINCVYENEDHHWAPSNKFPNWQRVLTLAQTDVQGMMKFASRTSLVRSLEATIKREKLRRTKEDKGHPFIVSIATNGRLWHDNDDLEQRTLVEHFTHEVTGDEQHASIIRFDAERLISCLKGHYVSLSYKGPLNAVVVQGSDSRLVHVIMPCMEE